MYTDLFEQTIYSDHILIAQVEAAVRSLSLPQTAAALPFARECHEGQYRKGPQPVPYITHPLTMVCHALALGLRDDDLLAALLLHDVLEDTSATADDLPVGSDARDAVLLVTKTPGYIEADYYAAIARHPLASLVKLFDRCHNISLMATGFTRERMASYLWETEQFILPLLPAVEKMRPELALPLWQLRYQLLTHMETIRRLL